MLNAADTTTPSDTSDPEPRFVGAGGVKPRAATAAGGPQVAWGLTPPVTTQAQSAIGWDHIFGNDIWSDLRLMNLLAKISEIVPALRENGRG